VRRNRANELGTHISSWAPDNFITATLSQLVGREEQHEIIGNFEIIELQPHAAVRIVFNEAGMFLALSKKDRRYASELVAWRPASFLAHDAILQVASRAAISGTALSRPSDPLLPAR
jgi:hypothetical protein